MNYFNLSETSSEAFYKPKQDGGFFGLFGNDYTPLLFSALEENNMEALAFLIKRPEIKSIKCKNNNGETILHVLVKKCNVKGFDSVLNSLLERKDIKELINIQDKEGNTPLHIAVINECNELAQNLIKAGANPLIKNKAGFYIEDIEEEVEVKNTSENKNNIFIPTKNKLSDTEKKYLNTMLNSINKKDATNSTSEVNGLTDITVSQTISKNIVKNKELVVPELSADNTTYDTSDILNTIMDNKNSEVSTTPSVNMNLNTSEFIENYLAEKSNKAKLEGGKKKTKKSKKLSNQSSYYTEKSLSMSNSNLTSSVDLDSSESEIESSESGSLSEMSELSRMINNQATEIHERSVKKIMEIMGVSEQEARVIKAFIYSEIRTQNPELNNFDRAVEMEKRITKEHLSKLDKKKLKELSEVISEKQKQKELSSTQMTSSSESATSSDSISTESSEEKPKKKTTTKEEKTKKSKKYF